MSRYNNGLIYTNDKCIGCNKCIFECPVIGANVSVYQNGMNRIMVNEKKCIHCGHCLNTCTHDARDYHDDTELFFEDLSAGNQIALAIAPSFYINYPQQASHILGYLRSLGVGKIYDVGFGADIATYCHIKYIEQSDEDNGQGKAYLARTCPALVNYMECCEPEMVDLLIPIHSPVICLGIYVHQYLKEKTDIAFISPCIAKKDEIDAATTGGNIRYNVTYKHLMKRLKDIDLSDYQAESDLKPIGLGNLFPMTGGFKEYIEHFIPREKLVLRMEGFPAKHEQLCDYCNNINQSDEKPCLIDILSCSHGCLTGPASEPDNFHLVNMLSGYRKTRKETQEGFLQDTDTMAERRERLENYFSELDLSDFHCGYTDRYHQSFHIPESTYDEIFNTMYKYTEADRNINCHSCGYSSCRDMVTAIAYGYNCMENCVHYTKDEVMRLYYTDPLTEIANKAAFIRDTTELLQNNENTQYVICTIDINNFTAVNDMYGFERGNQVLRFLARRLHQYSQADGTCARLDTDHFALCVPYEKSRLVFFEEKPYYDANDLNVDFPITVRFGLYLVEDSYEQVDKMLDLSAIAMNQNTDKSRNTYFFYNDDIRKELLEEASIARHMREAIKNEEFQTYLQPQYNHATGELVGAEVLCRWIRSDGSMISPDAFIHIFEKNGFIRELDYYMWDKTFQLVRKWLDEGKDPVPVAVNISRISLKDVNLCETFQQLSDRYQIEPERVHLEITEGAYMQNQRQIIEIIEKLQKCGFIIAMDDFGSGYSSLNTLKSVPIDILKLDMGFLRGKDDQNKGSSIISFVIRMAEALGLATIAEGVETIDQADFLKSIGCDMIQGFLYARPMPVEQYEKILFNGNNRIDK